VGTDPLFGSRTRKWQRSSDYLTTYCVYEMRDVKLEHDRSSVAINYSHQSIGNSEPEEAFLKPPMLEKCRYCGCSDVKSLKQCDYCGAVAYCSDEHQQFDWKRHKPMCKQRQAEIQRRQATADTSNTCTQTETSSASSADSSPPQTSFLAGTVTSSLEAQMASSLLSDVVTSISSTSNHSTNGVIFDASTSLASSPSSPRTSTSAASSEERIVPTDDPDIQIIESGPPSRTCAGVLLGRCRKRPTPSNSIIFKDHLKNLVYNTTLQDHQNMIKKRGLTLNTHQTLVIRLKYIAEYVIRSLNEFGWAVVDNFLGDEHCRFTCKEIKCLYERGLFSAGQLMDGKHKDEYHVKDIRSDQIYWFDGIDPRANDAATVRLLVSMIDSVVQHFKGRLPPYDISGRSRAMLAIYPGNGTRYVKHVDNPVKDGRCITTIYYCNEDWDIIKHGGTLRLYPETSIIPMDIDPKADRLVFFWSDRRNPHEVMPVFRPRFAVTIWYMDREERRKAIEKQAQEAGKSDPAQRSNEHSTATPQPIQRLGKDHMQMFPSTSSEPSLVELEHSDRDGGDRVAVGRDTVPKPGVGGSGSFAIRNATTVRDSSMNSGSDEDEEPLPRPSSPPPNYEI
ncbi:Hypoxia-inducible factor prolyl hydroxylase, partial [Trichostrongylus colubriformis]